MKMSEIFERAAEMVETDQFTESCFAIEEASGHLGEFGWHASTRWYGKNILCASPYSSPFGLGFSGEELKPIRVLALCFAAAIAKSEGL